MATLTRSGTTTFADFLELVHEDQKADLIDGVIYMASPENLEHNDIVAWLDRVLGIYVRKQRLGRITVNKVAYRLSDREGPEPDLAFVRTDRLDILRRGYVDGAPDLAIEIISPDSVHRDYELKRRQYERAGVQEYWIIDADEQKAVFLVRGPEGFIEAHPQNDIFASRVVPGFELDVRWLWQEPLPDELTIIQTLLDKPPSQ